MSAPPRRTVLVGLLLALGIVLRVWSFDWNDRLHGDVNLFALTAREFATTGELVYPLKYEFSDAIEYCETRAAPSQHPPLFPLVAGAVGRAAGSDETFFHLKLLSALGGLLLLLAFVRPALRSEAGLVALALLATSPIIVDFSSNGSLYVWAACILLAATRLVGRLPGAPPTLLLLAGVIAGLAIQLHGVLLSVPAAFVFAGWFERRRLARKQVLAFVGAFLVTVTPYALWTHHHFGRPFYANTQIQLEKIGLAREGIWDDVITWRFVEAAPAEVAAHVAASAGQAVIGYGAAALRDAGPAALALALVGLAVGARARPAATALRLLPATFFIGLTLILPFRERFIVPLLPLAFTLGGVGFSHLWHAGRRWIAAGLVLVSLGWMVPAFFESPPTRYYVDDVAHAKNYEAMLPIAQKLALLPSGVVLTGAAALDGGIEAAYYHRQPMVRGISHGDAAGGSNVELLRKLARDFDARYVWVDANTREAMGQVFPGARAVLGNGAFFVLELPPSDRAGGVCSADQTVRER